MILLGSYAHERALLSIGGHDKSARNQPWNQINQKSEHNAHHTYSSISVSPVCDNKDTNYERTFCLRAALDARA